MLLGADAIVVKGNEAGGFVSEEPRLSSATRVAVDRLANLGARRDRFAHGGRLRSRGRGRVRAGLATASYSGVAAPETERDWIASLDGSETVSWAKVPGSRLRVYARPGSKTLDEVRGLIGRRDLVRRHLGWNSPEKLRPIGQDAAFARIFFDRFRTTGTAIEALRRSVTEHLQAASVLQPLSEASALAHSHGTRFPIVQGPMTRVSDTAEFANAVAGNGGLPFLALAMMRGPEVSKLHGGRPVNCSGISRGRRHSRVRAAGVARGATRSGAPHQTALRADCRREAGSGQSARAGRHCQLSPCAFAGSVAIVYRGRRSASVCLRGP